MPEGRRAYGEDPQQVVTGEQRGEPLLVPAASGIFSSRGSHLPASRSRGGGKRRRSRKRSASGGADGGIPRAIFPQPPATVAETYAPSRRSGVRGKTADEVHTRHVVSDGTKTPWRNLPPPAAGNWSWPRKGSEQGGERPSEEDDRPGGKRSASRPDGKMASAIPKITADTVRDALAASIPTLPQDREHGLRKVDRRNVAAPAGTPSPGATPTPPPGLRMERKLLSPLRTILERNVHPGPIGDDLVLVDRHVQLTTSATLRSSRDFPAVSTAFFAASSHEVLLVPRHR